MTKSEGTQRPRSQWEFTNQIPSRWVTYLIYAISIAITQVAAATVVAITIVLLLLEGLWFAYTHLPLNVFLMALAVLAVDLALGIVMRTILSRR